MIPVAKLKKDMDFYKNLTSLVEVLKSIAVSQFHMLEKRMKTHEEFFQLLDGFFSMFDITNVQHPFINTKRGPTAVIAITSDAGLLGGLNMQVMMGALNEYDSDPGRLIVIGERGKAYLSDKGISFVSFPGIKDEERFSQAMQMRDYIIKHVISGAVGAVKLIYPRPISFTVQRVEMVTLLPYLESEQKREQKPDEGYSGADILMESTVSELAEYLVYLWIGQKIYEVFGWSRLAELAARFVHLENSSQKIKEVDKELRLQYFRARHEIVDRNMRELFAGRILYGTR